MLGGADNPNGELPSYITGADKQTAAVSVRNIQLAARRVVRRRSITS